MRFSQETLEQNVAESKPLLESHFKEIAQFQDIPLDPDYDQYIALEKAGFIRYFAARSADGALVGYAVYFVRHNLHYRSSLQAVQDVIFIKKEFRGRGGSFIKWIDEQLKAEGVQVTYHHVKVAHDFSKMLEKIGYTFVDKILARRLDK
jgi:hypothetical protein